LQQQNSIDYLTYPRHADYEYAHTVTKTTRHRF